MPSLAPSGAGQDSVGRPDRRWSCTQSKLGDWKGKGSGGKDGGVLLVAVGWRRKGSPTNETTLNAGRTDSGAEGRLMMESDAGSRWQYYFIASLQQWCITRAAAVGLVVVLAFFSICDGDFRKHSIPHPMWD